MAATATLIDYLRNLEGQGQTHVLVDEEAREILRSYFRRPQAPSAAPPREDPAPAAAVPAKVQVSGTTREERLDSLRQQAGEWEPALALGTLRKTMVFSIGNPEAPIIFVGEAPGYEEERRKEPLAGKAGEKFGEILGAMGLSREGVYITNLCKFRPAQRNQTTTTRKPSRPEMDCFLPFLRAEVGVIRPKCVVALGAAAAEGLLENTETVDRLRGTWHEFAGVPLRVTYHPAYLLHSDTALPEKRKVWEDMLCVMEALDLPINEKQRGFFLKK